MVKIILNNNFYHVLFIFVKNVGKKCIL